MPHQISQDTIPVRKGEEVNLPILEQFLRENIENVPNGPLEILQFSAGHSNLTYQIKVGDWEAVLRRPPLGPVAPKAHDMERECKILSELHPIFPVAPKPLLFSNKLEVVGSPFFIMERKNGIVLDTSFPKGVRVTKELCRQLSEVIVDRLVDLHSIDYQQTGLVEISRPDGFMERQVHGWIGRYERAKTDEVAEVITLMKWLVDHTPKKHEAAIIHYDYKLNNAMFNQDLTEMVGLFDWEMTTVGDPLVDLGAAMSYWIQADDPDLLKKAFGRPPVTVFEGFLTRNEFIDLYAKKSGRDVTNIHFYLTFAYFKLAVICQQIYYRYKKGQTNDSRFAQFNDLVKSLIKHDISISRI
ncbi:phosphotransferase family protein [Neobacillus niacini]|uniref:phosphotransferase family protein n=1 Tax=Neobacillus niacini TaxID=86668 RepID=UPI0028547787|nr:phosphotransferase family protein [Neobacillus niacini]MDR6998455.1 aminoglycoside phosphotransferase (APT) family kinase protein [Neobacillus niacini]